ncbi:hypothetical protein EES45_16550 [Streptomyces sp. ADI97-07]|uniref:hypothetical protein n=1 Tax=Streptomyces sp. ADI97-07 TaxID=1522762 RepID=UPI000F558792|nr:hypothetical protein [Streptomyces sp. ADI97-07]RPK78872.1 hypothetical protein EES45_16550 [Streptomyces sp. ADI97-07]
MMATAPAPEMLLDHRGNPRPFLDMPLAYEQARLGLAFHEAGHAVLAMAYGMHVLTSEVIAWSPEADAWSVTGKTAFNTHDLNPWHFATQQAAGEIAHVQYLLTYGLWTPERALACTADHDREQAIDVLADFGYSLGRDHTPEDGKSWGMVRGMARRKIGYLWREIRTVALAMDERTVLTGDDIATLTGLANPRLGEAA